MARQQLGRGLSALLGDDKPKDNVVELRIEQIEPNSEQPRTRFEDSALDELAASIKSNGIVQPVVVRPRGVGYQIVAGERRWRAAQRAGLHRIPVVVRDVPDEKLLELALIENIQREELNPIEEAKAYRKLIDSIGLTQEAIAERVGRERSLIATALRLLKLPDEVQALIEEGKLSAGHGRALLMSDDPAVQKTAARTIASQSLSVREAERLIKSKRSSGNAEKKGVRPARDANLISAETKLRRKLGTNVTILPAKSGTAGRLVIEYYTMDDLNRIYQVIMRGD